MAHLDRCLRDALAEHEKLGGAAVALPPVWTTYYPTRPVETPWGPDGGCRGRVFWTRGHLLLLHLVPGHPASFLFGTDDSLEVLLGPPHQLREELDALAGRAGTREGVDHILLGLDVLSAHFRPEEWDEARALARSVVDLWPASEATRRWLDEGRYEGAKEAEDDAWAHRVRLLGTKTRLAEDIARDGGVTDAERELMAAFAVRFAADVLLCPRFSRHGLERVRLFVGVARSQ